MLTSQLPTIHQLAWFVSTRRHSFGHRSPLLTSSSCRRRSLVRVGLLPPESIFSDVTPEESYLLHDSRHSTDRKLHPNVRLDCVPNRRVESALCRRVADRQNRRDQSLNRRSRCRPWI